MELVRTCRYALTQSESEVQVGQPARTCPALPTVELVQPASRVQVGDYLLLRELGRGGHAHVYLAEHFSRKSPVALKYLDLSGALHEDLVRFQFEARLLASLRHQHI